MPLPAAQRALRCAGAMCYEVPALNLVLAIDHLGSGGAQRQAVELGLELAREPGVRVSVLAYHEASFFAPRLEGSRVHLVRIQKRGRLDPTLPFRMGRWLRECAPDVVYAFMPVPAAWALLALRRLPPAQRPAFVVGDRSMGFTVTLVQAVAQRLVYRAADAVTVNAEPAVEKIHARLGVPRERTHYVPNGIDLAVWDRARAEACPLELPPGRFHVGLVGRLEPEKEHVLVLEALSRLAPERRAELCVWFVGAEDRGGAHVSEVHEEIRRRGLGDVVHVVPPIREMTALFSRLDALVLTSRFEGFPNVLLEAMASGLPSIATRVGDVPNMLGDSEGGILIDVGDSEALAAALLRLRAMAPAERAAMGARARAAVEARYQIAAVARQYLALFRSLAARRGDPLPDSDQIQKSV